MSTHRGLLLLAALAGLLGACHLDSSRASLGATRGYLLISIDTLRADHLGCYGYERDTSPFLDSLAARGILFENAIAHVPSTLPSHVSLFTGLYPAEHSVFAPDGIVPTSIPTLPERFLAAGFATAGFTDGGYMSGKYGFARGFEVFDDRLIGLQGDTEGSFRQGVEFLRRLGANEPFFLFLHTYAVHDPYEPPDAYRGLYWQGPKPDVFAPTGPNFGRYMCGHDTLSEAAQRYYTALYDAGINYIDDQLQRLFGELEAMGLLDDLTVVITSDHGEELGEHGGLSHQQIYHHNLHVPLIVLHPGLETGRREDRLVQSIDVAPTLIELAALEPFDPTSGVSLVPLLEETARHTDRGAARQAFARSEIDPSRTIYWQQGGQLYHLLQSRPRVDSLLPTELWVTPRGLSFDTQETVVALDAQSFLEPRVLEVSVDGLALASVELTPSWRTVELKLPPGEGKRTVTFTARGCLPAAAVGAEGDCRCLSFRVRGLEVARDELYALHADPAEAADLSARRADLAEGLLGRLEEATFAPLAEPQKGELDPELEEQLRALGYLQ